MSRLLPLRSACGAAVVLLLAAAFASCGKSPTGPSVAAAFSQTDLQVGTGTAAATGDTLEVNYTGWFYDPSKPDNKGGVFDTSIGRSAFVFTLGGSQVIPGWDQGLVGMKVGGVRRLIVPPSLGYGTARYGPIPPMSTLVFEVQLVNVTPAGS